MRIAKDCLVTLRFELTNESGQVLEGSPDGKPLVYRHGGEGILPILERALTGKIAGDTFDLRISPADGFGERQPGLVEVMPRTYLRNGGQLAIGGQVTRTDDAGVEVPYFVTAFNEETVTVDGNHPFAGMTLRFKGVVLDVREAAAEEPAPQN